jgi:hypothetical protein
MNTEKDTFHSPYCSGNPMSLDVSSGQPVELPSPNPTLPRMQGIFHPYFHRLKDYRFRHATEPRISYIPTTIGAGYSFPKIDGITTDAVIGIAELGGDIALVIWWALRSYLVCLFPSSPMLV